MKGSQHNAILLVVSACLSEAFVTRVLPPATIGVPNRPVSTFPSSYRSVPVTVLGMSSIQQDNNEKENKNEQQIKSVFEWEKLKEEMREKLPKAPEDVLTMSGDIGSLFLYCYLDHFVNHAYTKFLKVSHVIDAEKFGAHSVWLDPTALPPILQPVHWSELPCYSKMMSEAGISSVLIVSSWLIAGYFTEAFCFENTISCDARRSLMVTGKTFLLACAFIVSSTMIGNSLCGCPSTHSLAFSLTKTDADLIFDSVTVLLTWRFVTNSIFSRFM
mmetsp:Transcript_18977/g.24659  ORF Transcript_18977/g.24659 Transcript_18977/m.24659 type:complete len:273 (-) Transcript_18977:233-1051(-)